MRVSMSMISKMLCVINVFPIVAGCVNSLTIPPELLTGLLNAEQSQIRAQQTVQTIGQLMACLLEQESSAPAHPRCGAPQPAAQVSSGGTETPLSLSSLLGNLTLILTQQDATELMKIFGD